jgi:hypothetical protein
MAGSITNWKTFVESGRSFFDANLGCPMYQLIDILDDLYRLVYLKVPFPKYDTERDNFFHMCFMICHRALLSAATAIGSGQPEDAPATTRRALEAAKAVLAMKADPDNFTVWKAIEVRKERWTARAQGGTPKGPVKTQYKGMASEPLYQDLQAFIGVLSDYTVHFTPEHLLGYEWDQTHGPDGSADNSLGVDEDRVPKEFFFLADQHRLIIRVFDRFLDGKLLTCPEVKQLAQRALDLFKDLLRREGFTEQANNVGDNW